MTQALIAEAKARFGLCDAEHELIRHNENITCKLTDGARAYALRIRKPQAGFSTRLITGMYSDAALVQGEVELLLHMRRNGFDGLQQPVRNADGDYVTVLSDGSSAVLLTWVEGDVISKSEAPEVIDAVGEMAARLHRASRGFSGARPSYDEALVDRMIEEIYVAVSRTHLSEKMCQCCLKELEVIRGALRRLKDSEYCGIIHADLSLSNILKTEKGLIPIDFSLSGYGSYAQEAGMLWSSFEDESLRQSLMASIQNAGEDVSCEDAGLFLSFSVLLFICTQHERYCQETWFQSALQLWAQTLFVHWKS